MPFGATPLDGSATPIPMSSVVPDGTGTPVALEGGPTYSSDASGNKAPASVYVKDGNDVTQGALADSAATNSTSSWSVIAMLKGIYAKLAGTLTISGAVTTSGTVTEASAAAIKSDLDTLVTNTADLLADGDFLTTIATNTTGVATAANQTTGNTSLASIKTDLDSLVTNTADLLADGDFLTTISSNTGNIPAKGTAVMTGSTPVTIATNDTVFAELLLDTDNLATIAGIVSSNKGAVKAAAGDIADLAHGSATSANSVPVVVASDQGAVAIKRSTVAVYSLASTATSGSTQNSGDLTVGPYTEVSIDINTTAQSGTSPTIQYFYERKAADGIYYVLWQSAIFTAAANTQSTSVGAGMAYSQSLGVTGRIRWVVGGSNTPTYTHTINIQGK